MRHALFVGSVFAVLSASTAVRAESAAAFPDIPAKGARSSAPLPPVTTTSPAPAPAPAPSVAHAAPERPAIEGSAMTAAAGGSFGSPSSAPAPSAPLITGSWGGGGTGSVSFGSGAPREATADLPPGYVLEDGPAKTPLIIGGVVIGIPYATGLGIAAAQGFENGSGWLAAPVVGPWLALSGRRDPCDGASKKQEFDSDVGKCVAEPMIRGMLVLDGVLQASGAVLMVIGASSSESHVVKKTPPPISAAPTPMGKSGYGVAVGGVF